MDNSNDRIFFKSGVGYVLTLFLSALLFLSLLAMQLLSGDPVTCYIIGISLMVLSFLINIGLDKFGFYASFALNFIQFMVYIYEYTVIGDTSTGVLLVMSFAIMLINLVVQYYIVRMAKQIYSIKKSRQAERNARISKELEDEMFSRTSLIVNHEELGRSEGMSEAIGENLTSSIDPLTTLPGREMITDRIDRIIADDIASMQTSHSPVVTGNPFSIIYVALDSSEILSREIGHKKMDLFIQNMAHRIREAADPKDMVARLVNAEFIVLTRRNLPVSEIDAYAGRLARAGKKAFDTGRDSIVINISCGVSSYPSDGRIAGELIAKAEEAMTAVYGDASGVIGKVSMTPYAAGIEELAEASAIFDGKTRDEIASIFECAMTNGDIYMTFQPCFTRDRNLLGFEAFMRFRHEGRIIPPPVFIAAAENSGYIRRIGGFSIDRGLKALAHFNALNPNITMSLNISTNQLKAEDFIQSFSNSVSNSGCRLMNIILDIPEESLFTELPDIKSAIEKLNAMGVKLALDNFGRGYSSFNAIPLLPITVLKLDGNFTHNLASDETVRVLTSSAISLMHDIDIKVSATGVGSESQFTFLRDADCDIYQGRYMGTAMNEVECVDYLKKTESATNSRSTIYTDREP